jgi:hypothetical protein
MNALPYTWEGVWVSCPDKCQTYSSGGDIPYPPALLQGGTYLPGETRAWGVNF